MGYESEKQRHKERQICVYLRLGAVKKKRGFSSFFPRFFVGWVEARNPTHFLGFATWKQVVCVKGDLICFLFN
jgi:hypothetical protein